MEKDFNYYINLNWEFKFDKAEEGGFNARVNGLPCFAYGKNLKEAAENIQEALELYIEDSIEEKLPIPEPVSEECTGRLSLRVAKKTHFKLVKLSKEEDVSVSHLINDAIIKMYG